MSEKSINLTPIGVIKSQYKNIESAPIQPPGAKNAKGQVVLRPEYAKALKDLDGFSHIILIYHFHLCHKQQLTVKPFLDNAEHGVFSTRAPTRPNHLGLSVVRLESVEENCLNLLDVDVLDNTPLLDIKPFVKGFDLPQEEIKSGWLKKKAKNAETYKSDDRFK